MRNFRATMLTMLLLLLGIQGAWAEKVTFVERSWDALNNQVVATDRTEECQILSGNDDNWVALGEKGKTTYYVVNPWTQHKALSIFGEVHLILKGGKLHVKHIKLEAKQDAILHIHVAKGANDAELEVHNYYSSEDWLYGNYIYCYYPSAAAIGGGNNEDMGSLIIHDGNITVYTATELAAAIGGGNDKAIGANHQYAQFGGRVVVRHFNNTKQTESNGALIGGSGNTNQGGMVNMYGGTLDLSTYSFGAAIGGGFKANGGAVNIWGGHVKANGSYASCAIGGGYEGKGGNVHIYGGYVDAYSGIKQSAIGGSRGYDKGSVEIGKGLKVTAGSSKMVNSDTNERVPVPERVFTANERHLGCQYRTWARIETCDHTAQNDDESDAVFTYTVEDATYHMRHCRYCAAEFKEKHNFVNGVCACGQKGVNIPETWTMNIYTTTDGKTFAPVKAERVVKGMDYMLPQPAAIEGLIFMGYLHTATAQEGIEMKDSEIQNLVDAGTVVTPQADSTYYARYRYEYTENWTWNDERTEATVEVSNKLLNDTRTLTAIISEDTEAHKPAEMDSLGYRYYNATAAISRGAELSYYFTDRKDLVYYYQQNKLLVLDALAADSSNTAQLQKYEDFKVDMTFANLTLKKDGKLHALCLPFDVLDLNYLPETPLTGAKLFYFQGAKMKDNDYNMYFAKTSLVEAGRPFFYIFEKGEDISNPRFNDVVLKAPYAMSAEVMNDDDWGAGYGSVELRSTFEPVPVDEAMRLQVFSLEDGDINLNTEMVDGFGSYFFIPQLYDQNEKHIVRNLQLDFREGGQTILSVSKKLAREWVGVGNEASPYLIKTVDQLKKLSAAFGSGDTSVEGKYFKQAANLTFDKTENNNLLPIINFQGCYDGDGYTISGLDIVADKDNVYGPKEYAALFAVVNSGTVKNVIIRDSEFNGEMAAAVAARVYKGKIENCHVLKDVKVSGEYAGGIVEYLSSDGIVNGCSSQAIVAATGEVGGVICTGDNGTASNNFYLGDNVSMLNYNNPRSTFASASTYLNCSNNFYTNTKLYADKFSTLMPDKTVDNTVFLTQLAARDEFLLNEHSGLTKEQIGYNITLNNRTMKATQKADGTWQSWTFSICLPFDLDLTKLNNGAEFKVYRLHEVDILHEVLQFTNEFPLLEAGVPYMVTLAKGEIPLSATNATVVATPKEAIAINTDDGSKQVGWWAGTFKRIENDDMWDKKIYIAQAGRTFGTPSVTTNNAFVYPFVGYFSALDYLGFTKFRSKYIYTENGEETGEVTDFPTDEFESAGDLGDIETSISPIIQTIDADGTSRYYDLNGRQLNDKPRKGLYINNGKIMMNK